MSAEVLATAKLNLRLEVLGRTAENYHELRTSMLALTLGDRLVAEVSDGVGVQLSVAGEFAEGVPIDGSNLAQRAIEALLERGGQSGGLSLALEKRVPAGAGLGGGSADAAAALVLARELLGLGEDAAVDVQILSDLGSDTVFFRSAGTGHALCEGRGERVTERAQVGDWSILLLTPDVHASTAAVYGAFKLGDAPAPSGGAPDFAGLSAGAAREHLFNHLEASALALYPELAAWRGAFDASGLGHARLTGSGASFFALFDEEDEARSALEGLLDRAAGLPRPRMACVTAPSHGVCLGL